MGLGPLTEATRVGRIGCPIFLLDIGSSLYDILHLSWKANAIITMHSPFLMLRTIVALFLAVTLPVQASPTAVSSSSIGLQKRAAGFQLVSESLLKGSNLGQTCQQTLLQTINCDDYVATLGEKTYHGSLEDTQLTNTVCAATCEKALLTARRRISGSCASTPELITGYPVNALIESVVTGWNETCLKDKDGSKFCNGM